MILEKKLNETGKVEHHKVGLVAYSFRPRPRIDFDKTLAPFFIIAAMRLMLADLGSHMTTKHLDITIAFLEGKLTKKYT